MNDFRHTAKVQQGFSLLEVLVAFAILALAVATILSLFASGLRNTAVAAEYARALTLAESHLAAFQGSSNATQLESGISEGISEGFSWQSRVSPYEEGGLDAGRTRLYRIDVQVDWGEGNRRRSVQLSTLTLGQAK